MVRIISTLLHLKRHRVCRQVDPIGERVPSCSSRKGWALTEELIFSLGEVAIRGRSRRSLTKRFHFSRHHWQPNLLIRTEALYNILSGALSHETMGDKRKNTADGATKPAKGRPGLKSVTASCPVALEARPPAPSPVAVETLAAASEGGAMTLLESDVPKTELYCDECHYPLKPPVYQVIRTNRENQNLPSVHPQDRSIDS